MGVNFKRNVLDFKDVIYKELLNYSEKLYDAIVEARKSGNSTELATLIHSHKEGKFKLSKVSLVKLLFKYYFPIKSLDLGIKPI